jgi:hypothetical protein
MYVGRAKQGDQIGRIFNVFGYNLLPAVLA